MANRILTSDVYIAVVACVLRKYNKCARYSQTWVTLHDVCRRCTGQVVVCGFLIP